MMFERWRQKYIGCSPQEKIRIAVMYQVASYWPTIESFYEACVNDTDIDIRIFYVGEMSVEKVQVEGSDRFLIERGIPFSVYSEAGIEDFRPHAALYQPPYDVGYRNPDALSLHLRQMGIRIVYIPYGIEIADTEDAHYNHFHTFVIKNAWRIYTFSEMMKKDYMEYCPNRQAVRALGLPKFDSIANREKIGDKAVREGAAGRKMVLWKMHFPKLIYDGLEKRQVTPSIEEYLKFAERIESYANVYFVVMPHPMFFSQTIDSGLAAKAKMLFEQLKGKKNVYIDHSEDYRNSLYHADAIIVDRSAVMVEAGFLNVPVLYMKNADYEEPLTKAVARLVDSYEQGTACADMQSFVERFCKGELDFVTQRIGRVRESIVSFEAGRCGVGILEDIKTGIMEPEDTVLKIAFFGASLTCDHYIEKLGVKDNAELAVVCLSDNDSNKWGKKRSGIEVVPPSKLKELNLDLIVITSEQFYMPMKKQLVYELYLDEEKIMRLDRFSEMLLQKN